MEAVAHNILLVEDHHDTAETLSILLRRQGLRVTTVSGYQSALGAAHAERFDVVLCDIGLPDGDGCQLFQELRRCCHAGIKGIAVTAYGMEHDVERCRRAGFAGFVLKPFTVDQVITTIRRVLHGGTTAPGDESPP
jgi:CheY-like chemotaxis protein